MKKKPSLYNIIITIACIILLVLLYRSHYMQASKQTSIPTASASVPAVTPMQTPLQTPPMPTSAPWMLEESYYQPFGELPLPALQQYAGYDAERTQHSLREENSIDIAFAPYWGQPESTFEENALSAHYQECWEAEVSHALDLLAKQASPAAEYIPEMTQQVRDKLLDFADSSGELYADLFKTDVFLYEGDSPGQTISIGTAYPGTLSIAKAAFFRSYTF